jgi:RHS repeat-associated protein
MAASSPRARPPVSSWLRARQAMLGSALARLEVRRAIVITLTLITILLGPNGFLTNLPITHAQTSLAASGGTPNRFDPTKDAQSILHLPQTGTSDPTWTASSPQPITRPFIPSMQPGTLTLTPGQAATFLGSDGRLEVDVPGTAVTTSDRAAAGGTLTLQITEIAAPAGSSAGGWGVVSLGTYLLQVVDSTGKEAAHGFHAPLTLKLHYQGREGAFDLTHAFVVLNGGVPKGTKLATPAGASRPTFGAGSTQQATLDSTSQTLAVASPLLTPSSSISWNTFAPVSTFGKPDPFNVSLNAGALSMGWPIDVPSGPGGLTPPVQLGYSSESVAEQHSVQGAAPWVGEGWSLGLGSISWSEHNATSNTGTATWEDTWQLSDPFGTSAQLIPPTVTASTYYDDTPNAITPSPVTWHTSPETHAKIISYVGPNHLTGMTAVPPCFRVFLPNGIMEEFGCTVDSLEYYAQPSGANAGLDYISNWMLDLITDRSGNQIHITYQRDMVTVSGHTYPRDAQLATIEWDSPSCHSATTACTSPTWAPQMRVNFVASHTPTRFYPGTGPTGTCNTGTNLRCDDPKDLSGSSGLTAPNVQTTYVLNDIQVQVRSTGTGSWNTLRDYQLSYEQSGPTTITDPMTSKSESVAGMLDLTKIQEVGDDGTTTDPARIFSYTSLTQYYEDDVYTAPAGNCGPSWNSGCLMWSQSYAGNSRYLATADNGLGLHQIFSYANARNNTHGVNGGGTNTLDPLYCNSHQTGYPCNQADDQNWSHTVLTQEEDQVVRLTQAGQGGTQTNTMVDSKTAYSYQLTTYTGTPCSDCTQGMYWGNQNDADYLDYYNSTFMGFAQATVDLPDGTPTVHGSVDVHKFYTTLGWGIYDTSVVTCFTNPPNPCHNDPWWDAHNAEHGREYEVDHYDTDGTTLLSKIQTQYQLTCPPSGVSGSGSSFGGFDGNLVSELDHNNPVASCDIQTKQMDTYTYDGSTASGVPHQTVTYAYDSYGRQTSQTTTTNDGGATGSPTTIVAKTVYVWYDGVTATSTSASGPYLIDFPAFTDTEDSSGNRYSCTYTSYSGLAWQSGSQSTFSGRPLVTRVDQYTNCGTLANSFNDKSGPITTTHNGYDVYGNSLTTRDPDANAGDTSHEGCTENSNLYTTCTTYDTTYDALSVSNTNALNQAEQTSYTQNVGGGFGLWQTSTTDVNGQTTTYTYDGLGRMTSRTMPGETTGLTTSSWTYTSWCSATGAQSPCLEVDETQRLNAATTITTRAFYDGFGRLVEVRSPGFNGQDVVHYRYFDPSGRDILESLQYFVPAYTGAPGAAAYSIPDSNQPGSTTTYDGLGRTTSTTDVLSNTTTTSYTVVCGTISGDSACYEQGLVIDPLHHQQSKLGDALGREIYDQRYTGDGSISAPYAVYATTKYTYDYTTNLTQIKAPDGTTTTTFQFDMAGRQTGLIDPDRGTESYIYDPNGNRKQSTDARGSSGTVYVGYDGLNRQLWRSVNSNGSSPYATYTYDSTVGGNYGVGHVTSETFTNGTLSGSYSYVYDQRGQQTSNTLTVGTTPYTVQTSYDDASNVLTQTYPDGEVVTNSYTAQGWFSGLTTQVGSTLVNLVNTIAYTGVGGAGHLITGASLDGGMYQYATTYDQLLRLTDANYTLTSGGTTLYDEQRNFDGAGNVTNQTTTLPQGTDVQAFCYDEQNRLTWAGSVGTPPCIGTAITPGTLTAANYTQSFSYDTLGRLTSGPLGSYTYGASAHVHVATSIGSAYTATYDAAGNETCRAPTSATTCAGGSPTGAQLSYDNEGRMTGWQNAPSSPSTTDSFLYDSEGNRVAQQAIQGGSTTTTVYVGNLEEASTTGSTTTTTTYYYIGGQRIALSVSGVFSYLATDAISSVSVAFDANGNVQASQLFAPYGGVRYSNGTMPGTYGFTGQHADSATGLDYYGARYYDPVAGQFTSADTVLPGKGYDPWGLSRYAYVAGNPITRTDPDGHDGLFGSIFNAVTNVVKTVAKVAQAVAPVAVAALDATTGIPSMINDVKTVFSGNASTMQKLLAIGDIALNVAMDAQMVMGTGEGERAAYMGVKVAEEVGEHVAEDVGAHALEDAGEHAAEDEAEHMAEGATCPGLSFSADTLVATPSGERAISTLHVGDQVLAYDPQTHQVSVQTVQHVWINHDTDLIDVTVQVQDAANGQGVPSNVGSQAATGTPALHSANAKQHDQAQGATGPSTTHDETIHTTMKHPWLTSDQGWVTASQLKVGEPVVQADGKRAVVVALRVIPGAGTMYDLEVSNIHTFVVGIEQFVVHNCGVDRGAKYEQDVRNVNGDPYTHEHEPISPGGPTPDAIRVDPATGERTLIDAKYADTKFNRFNKSGRSLALNQLENYARSGEPFEYWFHESPAQTTIDLIEKYGGNVVQWAGF